MREADIAAATLDQRQISIKKQRLRATAAERQMEEEKLDEATKDGFASAETRGCHVAGAFPAGLLEGVRAATGRRGWGQDKSGANDAR